MSVRLILVMIALVAGLSVAQSAQQTGRYVLKQTSDGFIRLDTETGSLAHCSQLNGKWTCENLYDGNSANRDEVARLSRDNRELKDRVARLEAKLGKLSASKSGRKSKVELPSDEELDEIMGFFEKLVMRFMRFARTLQDAPGEDI